MFTDTSSQRETKKKVTNNEEQSTLYCLHWLLLTTRRVCDMITPFSLWKRKLKTILHYLNKSTGEEIPFYLSDKYSKATLLACLYKSCPNFHMQCHLEHLKAT